MTLSCTITSNSSLPEEEIHTGTTSSNSEGASEEVFAEISLPSSCQVALLKPMTECCQTALLRFSEKFSENESKNKPNPKELLQAKQGILARNSSLPKTCPKAPMLSSSSQEGKTTLYTQPGSSSPSYLPNGSKIRSLSLPFSTSSLKNSKDGQKLTTIIIQLPTVKESKDNLLLLSWFTTQLHIPTYRSKVLNLRNSLSNREQTTKQSSHAQKSSTNKSWTSTSTPMSLFSNHQTNTHLNNKNKSGDRDEGYGGGTDHEESENSSDNPQEENEEIESLSANTTSSLSTQYQDTVAPKEFKEFLLSESQLSVAIGKRIANIDILRMCAEIMKIMLKSRKNAYFERLEMRRIFIEESLLIADSYIRQAKMCQVTGVAMAVCSIVGSLGKVFGEIFGEGLLSSLQRGLGLFKNASPKTFFDSFSNLFSSLSQICEQIYRVYELKESAYRSVHEAMKENARMMHDEMIRSIEEIKDEWKNMEHLLMQIIQNDYDTIRHLYQ
ncbi:hypothetical protein CP10139811_0457 [Chlamydia ibidis]|uniref:Uncharacterized protein n=2 Tax=Chlamydia ibidis TaxID=1405396 RepID=S7J4D3_9CHLA|nr:hypothetical protein [Chlamydia ibidis]EPP34897.1 hypothetical protein CP10139811_0457 [Chlamydia ibidis]EQM62347.1 hypothetical protein H359_0835 [Chlamydia ibidis 10-1398/6]